MRRSTRRAGGEPAPRLGARVGGRRCVVGTG
jgi:hypothetical protein